ncbi:MAG: hypothetical protein R2800_07745 [Flavipsychrobacter sp.]
MKRIYFITLLLISAVGVQAQTTVNSAAAQSAKLALSNAIELTFVEGSGGISNMEFSSLNDLVNGVESDVQHLVVQSNKHFDITVSAPSSKFSYTGSSIFNNILSVASVLKITCTQANGGQVVGQTGIWKNFNLFTPTTLLTNCSPGGNQTFSVKYKATPGITAASGVYTTNVIFTATQQ